GTSGSASSTRGRSSLGAPFMYLNAIRAPGPLSPGRRSRRVEVVLARRPGRGTRTMEVRAVRVLIADDNRLMLDGFRRALEPVEDIEIVGTTHTGAQVLPLVERRRPELVAPELGMRGEDGRSCLELLRERH